MNKPNNRFYTINTQQQDTGENGYNDDDLTTTTHPKTKTVTLRLYRILMRQVQSLSKQSYEGLLLLQPPLDTNDSGKYRIFRGGGGNLHQDGDPTAPYHVPIDFLSIIEWFDEQQRAHHQRQRRLQKQQKREQRMSKTVVPRIFHTGNYSLAFFDLTAKASNNNKKSSSGKISSSKPSDDDDSASDDEDDDDYDSDQDNTKLDSKTKRNVPQRPAKSWEYYLHPEWQGEHPSDTTTTTTTTTTFLPMDEFSAVWCHVDALARAIRVSFRNANIRDFPIVPDLHQRAFAAYRILQHIQLTWSRTSVHTERNIRIACTSSCVAKSYHPSNIETVLGGRVTTVRGAVPKYRYAYRIRIENLSPPSSGNTVQLLGRTWCVHQNTISDQNDTLIPENKKDHVDDHDDDDDNDDDDVVRVVAPNTGVVGQLPVLSPGTAFEYQSGAEAGARGKMEGCLHFCVVPDDTPSTTIGTAIPAFESDQRFAIPVKPFPLIADDFNMENTDP
jgi:uncharacterized protein affecting Mg2+/Co2+ transport